MKKVIRFFALAAMTACMTTFVACGDKDDDGNDGNNTTNNEPEAVAVPLEEDFEDGAIPEGWTLIDADGDGICWEYEFGPNSGQPGPYSQGIDGSNCISSASWDGDPLTPDNYIVSPEFHVHSTGGYTLTWYDAAQDAEYPADHYSVYAGTLENGVFKPMGDAIFSKTLSSADFTKRTVDLKDFNGKDIRIAFRHHDCTDMFLMKIDNVKVSKDGAKGPATIACDGGAKRVR